MSSSSHLRGSVAAVVAAAAVTLGTTVASMPAAMALPQPPPPPYGGSSILDADHHQAGPDATRATGPGVYIVSLVQRPSAVHTGGVPGRPTSRLVRTQDRVLARIGDPEVLYRFTTAVNGFVARLDAGQVKQLRATPGVALVERSTTQKVDTVESPDFLGLDQAWNEAGGVDEAGGADEAGRGTVIGVIDSGIWPENPSFAGLPDGSEQVRGFHGACQAGEQWDAADCNDKVVSARYYVKGFGRQNLAQSEYLSPRDGGGHGSHTAATAAGNHDVAVRIDGQRFGSASGMAPGARIAAYKVCWAAPNPGQDGCTTADAVAAIDQAVADGVDVINYSISGAQGILADSVELAFLNASAAGVFVAASAGDGGPGAGTVAHPSPWVTTVGASTHHLLQGSVVLGDTSRAPYVGAMVSDTRVPRTHIVLSSDVAAAGASTEAARICEIGSLDATLVQDNIVVCDRGTTARVDKSAAVARAGGAGMVLVNVAPDSVDADFQSVPTVHVDVAAGDAVKSYVRDAGSQATAAIDPAGADDTAVPQIADFSARGPSAASGDVLKPDLTAPGVSVVAAVAPPSNSGRLWDLYSGTSMSSPHVAGLAALVAAERPQWSPAEIKSAMMTTADQLEGGAGPFAQGAGNVDPAGLLDPGLVFDAVDADYRGFLAGMGFAYADGSAVSGDPIDASELNAPSIAVGGLTGTATVTRRVTNLSGSAETFTTRLTGLDGIDASVDRDEVTVAGGGSATFTVRFTATDDASPGNYARGALTLTSIDHEVRIPIAVRPELVDAPAEVTGTGGSGSVTVAGVSGTDGEVELSTAGLVYATPTGVTLVPGAFDPTAPDADADTFEVPVTIGDYTDVARFEMDAHNAGDDLDVYVYRGAELVGLSAGGSADETVTLVEPEAGDYRVYVSSHAAENGSTTTGQFYSWVVGEGDSGNLRLSSTAVRAGRGERFSYKASWAGLDASRWFGSITYAGSGHRTLVTIR